MKLSLSKKALLSVFIILLPIVVAFFYGYHHNKELLKNHVLDDLTIVAETFEGQVYQYLEMSRRRVEDFSTDGFIVGAVEEAVKKGRSDGLSRHLKMNKLPIDRHIQYIHVIDMNGRVVASTDRPFVGTDVSNEPFFKPGARSVTISESAQGPLGHELAVCAPVRNKNGDIVAVIANFQLLSELDKVLNGDFSRELGAVSWNKGRRGSTNAYLVNRDARMITHAAHTRDGGLGQPVKTEPVMACVGSRSEFTGFYRDFRGVEVVGASMCLPELGWTLLVEVDAADTLKSISRLRNDALVTAAVVAGLIGLLFAVFFRKVVLQLRMISNAAGSMAGGEYGIALPVRSTDELGALCESFNIMSQGISDRDTALRMSEEKYRSLVFNIPDVSWTADPQGNTVFISPNVKSVLGYSPEEIYEAPDVWFNSVHPDDIGRVRAAYSALFTENRAFDIEFRMRKKDGRWVWLNNKSAPAYLNNKKKLADGAFSDVTGRKTAELALKESQEMLESILDNSASIVCLKDTQGRYIFINKRYEDVFDVKRAAIQGKTDLDIFPEQTANSIMANDRRVLEAGVTTEFEEAFPQKDGERVYISNRFPLFDAWGRAYAVCGFSVDITERKNAVKALRESQDRLNRAQQLAHMGSWEWDIVNNRIFWSDEIYSIFGLEAHQFDGTYESFMESVLPEDRELVKQAVFDSFYSAKPYSVDHRVMLPGGRVRVVHEEAKVSYDELDPSRPVRMVGTVQDITERKQTEFELKKLSMAIEHSVNIVFITDVRGSIQYVNPMFEQVTGYSKQEAIGQTPRILASGEVSNERYEELWKTILSGKTWRSVFKNKKKTGGHYWCSSVISPIKDERGAITHFLSVQEDVTEKMLSEERLRYLAQYDELTGLSNRTWFMEEMEKWLVGAGGEATGVLLLIDMDQFKFLNDTYGHGTGDEFLRRISAILRSTVDSVYSGYQPSEAERPLIGRLSGDEFSVFLPAISKKDGLEIAERLRRAIEGYRFAEASSSLTVSVGIVLYPDHGPDTKTLFTKADAAMYRAKELGRNRLHLYRPEDQDLEKMHSRLSWKEKILKALAEDRFEPWFQPILEIKPDSVRHYEALARMRDENGSILLPGAFVDIAERFGLIGSIDRMIIEKTMRLQARMKKAGVDLSFSMNLSGKDLGDEELLLFLKSKMGEIGPDPSRLTFEITETAAIGDLERAKKFINSLKSLGCRFSLDDFGVGFTSFVYLKEMQLDFIKIDGSFIRKLHENPADQVFVKAITDVAKGLGIKSVAEFVEGEGTLKLLRKYGVDYAQGYLIGKPAPTLLDTHTKNFTPKLVKKS